MVWRIWVLVWKEESEGHLRFAAHVGRHCELLYTKVCRMAVPLCCICCLQIRVNARPPAKTLRASL